MITRQQIENWMMQLDSDDTTVKEIAIRHLLVGGDAVIQPLVDMMNAMDGFRSLEAAKLLAQMDHPQAIQAMQGILYSSNILIGEIAVKALRRHDGKYIDALIKAIPECHHFIQLQIVRAFEDIGDQNLINPLTSLLKKTESTTLQYTIIRTLSTLGDPKVLPLIEKFTNSPDHHVRKQVRLAKEKLESQVI